MKIIRIDRCVGCPSCEYDDELKDWWCRELSKFIDKRKIDPDCPLEEAEDGR